jgi:hypothetical protein
MNLIRSFIVVVVIVGAGIGQSTPAFAQAAQASQVSLVPIGATWKFLADGSDPGTAWRSPDFNDASWSDGPAKLGFGDEDVTTTIGGDPAVVGITTAYFRHAFQAADASTLSNFLLRLLRDDGAVVYLNGTEIFRSNMPSGEITSTTLAELALGEPEEAAYVSTFFTENHLKEGRNVLAVEVHQSSIDSSDLGFNLELLAGYQLVPPSVAITSPAATDVVVEGAVTVVVDAAFVGGDMSTVTLFSGDQQVGEATAAPYTFTWTAAPGTHTLTARAVTPQGLTGTSAPVAITVVQALIQQGATWKYLADGSNQGRAWREPDFDDSAWSEGRAELGYGDDDETTVVPSGPDSSTNFITTYFRASFSVESPSSITALEGLLTYDDGAVVYLNGTEIFRINMAPGDPAFNAPAVEGLDYDPAPFSVTTPSLRPGVNVIAVEIHQSSTSSSDISFDLMLRGIQGAVAEAARTNR